MRPMGTQLGKRYQEKQREGQHSDDLRAGRAQNDK
jgi:hypothetical protein